MDKIDLTALETEIVLRNVRDEDLDELVRLSEICFPEMDPWKRNQLESHLVYFPEGQFCIEYNGTIIGASSSLIIDYDEYEDNHNFDEISDEGYISNHDPEGLYLYGIAIMVHPEYRRLKIGSRLYEKRKQLVEDLNLKGILIGGRIPRYHKFAHEMSPREYVKQVVQHKIYDPVLTFQLMNEFVVKRVNKEYLDDDEASMHYAVLLEWSNVDYLPKSKRHYIRAYPVRICTVQYRLKKIDSFEEFARQCEYYVETSSVYESDFVLFPESFTMQLISFLNEPIPSKQVRKVAAYTEDYIRLFSELAVKHNVNIIGGSHFVEEDEKIYNVSYLFHRSGKIDKQYKLHITPDQRKWWGIQPGDLINVFNTDRGKVAILICYDIQFPELSRIVTNEGANIIFVPFCTDDRNGYLRVRYCSQARAIENQIYTAIAGTVGNLTHVEKADMQYAQSGIFCPSDFSFAPDGIIGECTPNLETIVVGDVDLEILRRSRTRGTVTHLKDKRKDLYKTVRK